ncbi:MAG: hypothetical protein NT178_13575 [Proteobacteria bacterium]|nr:hypothetical protein [Pseudomonadota bacterium]
MKKKVIIIPCSGVGKAYGEIGRQAVYETIDSRPESASTVCLARLMIDDPETKATLKGNSIITVDGCAKDCAKKNVESAGMQPDCSLRVIETFKGHRDLKPTGILELGDAGFTLVHILAERIQSETDLLLEKEVQQC